jgi:hypothetical protein
MRCGGDSAANVKCGIVATDEEASALTLPMD